MKYVIFEGHGSVHPVLCADHTSHCQLKVDGCVPVSGGFVNLNRFGVECVYGRAESLNLENRGDEDVNILQDLYLSMGMYAFLRL